MVECSTDEMSSQYTFIEWYSFELGVVEFEFGGFKTLGSCGHGAQRAAPLQDGGEGLG
jgi:hypothetical protein